jgi:hypothetical protein
MTIKIRDEELNKYKKLIDFEELKEESENFKKIREKMEEQRKNEIRKKYKC